jgi:Fe2+ transport system protein FeoA
LEQLQKHLRIEEESRARDKSDNSYEGTSKANAVEKSEPSTKTNKRKPSKNFNNSKKKTKGSCFVCGKSGHYAKECRYRKKNNTEGKVNSIKEDNIVATVSEINAIKGKVPGWWYDTCATIHVSYDKSLFKTYFEIDGEQEIQMGNEVRSKVYGKGNVDITFTSGKTVTLTNVLHVPDMNRNLVSGDLLGKPGIKCVYESGKLVLSLNGKFVGKGYSSEGMVKLCTIDKSLNNKVDFAYIVVDSFSLWHARLGHISKSTMKRLLKCDMISYNEKDAYKCKTCIESKMIKKPYQRVNRTSNILELIHTDICELNGMLTRGGNRYFITFIDDYSRYTYVYLIKHKHEAFDMFKTYKNEVENHLSKKIKILRSDRGGEYFSSDFNSFCEQHGIVHQCSAPRTPEQNGLAERKNRTLVDMINAMLMYAKLPFNLWGEALLSACRILNRIPSKNTKVSPYELWKGRKPNIGYFKVWGCLAYCKNTNPNRTKLGPRGIKCAFVGYANNSKSYRLLNLETNVIIESNDVEFFENSLSSDNELREIHNDIPSSSGTQDETSSKDVNESSEPRRSKRTRIAKSLGSDEIDSQLISFYLVEGNSVNVVRTIPFVLQVETDPKTYKEAMTSRDNIFWKDAIKDEMDSIMSNNTWELVDLPPGSKPIGCKWVFRRKYNTDGSLNTFKARLVAKGYRQKEGIDYFDTYAPVARITSIRILFALASIYDLHVHQMDVKTAFLNGDLDEEVYMEQPEGFILPGNEHKVCKLVKSLYGLKQAPKKWHEKFDLAIISFGFKHNSVDKCLYCKVCENYVIFICLYVDDMLIMCNHMDGIKETKRFLSSIFKMKDLGKVDTILGIKVTKNSGGFYLSQSHYIESVINKFKHLNIKDCSTPLDPSSKLMKNDGREIAQLEYASAIGSLMYAVQCTRPDIAFAISKLSRFTSNPSNDHWKAIGRVLGYLKKTKNLGLQYTKFPAVLEGFTDASWISSTGESKSTSGWVFTLGGGAVSWKSKKQTCITHSTMESEFVALSETGKEAEWLKELLYEIPLGPKIISSIPIMCDSQATLAKAYNEVYNGKSRHMSLRHDYIRKLIKSGIISLNYVKSIENLADPLTKPLNRDLVNSTTSRMGLKLLN